MKIIRNTDVIQLQHGEFCYNGRKQRDFTGEKVFWRDADKMWKSIRWYKGLYEINENAAVRNVIMISFCICVSFWNSFKMIKCRWQETVDTWKRFLLRQPCVQVLPAKKVKVTQTRQARFSCRVCAEKAYGRYFAREEKSSGRGASNIRFLPSKGCSRKSFQAWRAARVNGRDTGDSPVFPYKVSPRRGCPVDFMCTRIWWVRPVSRKRETRDQSAVLWSTW